jgi:hypothetical protein
VFVQATKMQNRSGEHQRLYGFRPIAAPRPYRGVKFETQLLTVRRSELKDYVRAAKPMTKAWGEALTNLVAFAPCLCA